MLNDTHTSSFSCFKIDTHLINFFYEIKFYFNFFIEFYLFFNKLISFLFFELSDTGQSYFI